MAESKPHAPTPNRLKRARREGNVARSPELSGMCAALAGIGAIVAIVPIYGGVTADWITQAASDGSVRLDHVIPLFALAAAAMICAACAGLTASLAQEKLFFVFPKFKLERLNPSSGIKRMFSPEAAVSAARAVLAFTLACVALVPTAREVFARGSGISSWSLILILGTTAAIRIVLVVVGVGLVFAIFDVMLARRRWLKKLRMSTYELRRDLRESDGDPYLRNRRRRMHRRMSNGGAALVKKAAFVVTNPTHIAIALEYRPPDVAVPRVLVRAAEESAAVVRVLAAQHGVPLIENVTLARELYATTEPGDEIPGQTYLAVAEIVNALRREGALA